MSTVNVMAREIASKVVFYGPGLSGKTTTLKRIYESIKPSLRGELMSLPTEADRTLFFDFLPVRVERVGEYSVRLALYTVPGQVFYNATRKLVLQGADGVVFVADSNPAAEDANRESMANLEENLAEQGIRLEEFPLVIQYNKRDLGNAMDVAAMRAMLNPRGVPDFETCATNGKGILDAMKAIVRAVIKDLRARKVVPSPKRRSVQVPALKVDAGSGLESQIQEHLDREGGDDHAEAHAEEPLEEVAPVEPIEPIAPPAAKELPAPPDPHTSVRPPVGAVSALAPSMLLDAAQVAEAAFAAGDYNGCVRACLDTVRKALAFAGEGGLGVQGYLLGVAGKDLLKLQLLAPHGHARVDEAAFALYVLGQTLVRLSGAGLPEPTA